MGGLYSNAIYPLHNEIVERYVLLLSSGFDLILSHLICFTVICCKGTSICFNLLSFSLHTNYLKSSVVSPL